MRLEEAPEARLAGRLPGNRLIQWSHRDELVEPAAERETELEPAAQKIRRTGGGGGEPTGNGAVSGPGGDGRPPLVEEDVGRLLAHVLVGHRGHLAVVEAVPLAVDGVPAVGCRRQRPRRVNADRTPPPPGELAPLLPV